MASLTYMLDAIEAALKAGTQGPWIADCRSGMVAVYPGPKLNCLVDTLPSIALKWYRQKDAAGQWIDDPALDANARLICALLNSAGPTVAAADKAETLALELRTDEGHEFQAGQYLLDYITQQVSITYNALVEAGAIKEAHDAT